MEAEGTRIKRTRFAEIRGQKRQGPVGIERMLAFVLRAAGSDWGWFSAVTWKDSHLKGPAAAECRIDCRAGVVLAARGIAW